MERNRWVEIGTSSVWPEMTTRPLLRSSTERIRIARGDLEGFLHTLEPGALSKLYLSDLFEWVSAEHHEEMLRAIAAVTRPGGRFVYWNLLVPRSRPDSLAELIEVHPERSRELHGRDLAFVYGSFHVESVRGGEA